MCGVDCTHQHVARCHAQCVGQAGNIVNDDQARPSPAQEGDIQRPKSAVLRDDGATVGFGA